MKHHYSPLPQRLSASSLLESVVALSLLGLIFLIGSQIWLQVIVQQSPQVIQERRLAMRTWLMEPLPAPITARITQKEVSGFILKRTVKPYAEDHALWHIAIECLQEDIVIDTRHRLIPRLQP